MDIKMNIFAGTYSISNYIKEVDIFDILKISTYFLHIMATKFD